MGVIELYIFVGILLGNIYQYSVLITIYQAPAQNAYCPIKNCFYSVVKYSKRNNFNLLDQIRCFWWQGNSMSELVKAVQGASGWRPFQEHLDHEPVSLVMADNGLATEITNWSKLPGTWGVLIHSQFTRVMAQLRLPCMTFFPKSQLYHMTGSTRLSPHFSYCKRQNWAWRPGRKARFSTYDLQMKTACTGLRTRACLDNAVSDLWILFVQVFTWNESTYLYIATLATEYSTEWNLHLSFISGLDFKCSCSKHTWAASPIAWTHHVH